MFSIGNIPDIEIAAGVNMPILGYGTWQANSFELETALNEALTVGYRHFDTAFVYENEKILGKVFAEWIARGQLDRRQLFIVTKLPPIAVHADLVEIYLKKSLMNLQVDYVDLYLVHTPFSFRSNVCNELHPFKADGEIDFDPGTNLALVWKEMEKQVRNGKTKSIGVSNFNQTQIENIMKIATIPPANLQIELHIYFQQNELVEFCNNHNISITAYSPLGSRNTGMFLKNHFGIEKHVPNLFENETIKSIAKKHQRSEAQILLRFTIERGIAVIPKSTNANRIRENFQLFDFQLDRNDLKLLTSLDCGKIGRLCDFNFLKGYNCIVFNTSKILII